MGRFGQRCAHRQHGHRLRGVNVTSPLPARAASQVEVSEGSAHHCSRASLHPSRERRIWRQALLPLHPCALPGHPAEGKALSNFALSPLQD